MKKNCLLLSLVLLFCTIGYAQKPNNLAEGFLSSDAASRGFSKEDLSDKVITSEHISRTSGVHHIYYRQQYDGIQINGANASVHIMPTGQVLTVHNDFVADLDSKITGTTAPLLTAQQAIEAAAQQLGYTITAPLEIIEENGGTDHAVVFSKGGISQENIPVKLIYQKMEDGTIKLAWDLSIDATSETNWWSLRVDASNGTILHKDNWTVHCNFEHSEAHSENCNHHEREELIDEVATAFSPPVMVGTYNVYAMPVESPNFGGRTLVANPDNATASPYGWHDDNGAAGAEYTVTTGNNVDAYEDGDNSGFSPDGGGSLIFNFPINTTYSQANQSESAAITNLFYWSNICHDLWYLYGFDEASGNFQENNYNNGGAQNDYCRSEAQDGSGTCNANMSTPTDGSRPRMQMYVCNSRDGDLDNGVIVHEYGHGISIRLTGGANNSGCLSNQEQMGEGWSDYFGMVMTIEAGDAGTDSRGMGTWLFGQGPNGAGIRPHPYSTDFAINPHTYDDIKTEVAPHGVGSVWCAMLWEMTWDLIAVHGFDPDFYGGVGGNNIAMAIVLEGLKLQPCSPGFVDGRDAIIAADLALYGGANECIIWEAFARRGLGVNASQGSSGSKSDGTENFDVPGYCLGPAISFEVATINTVEGAAPESPSPPGECLPYTDYDIVVELSQDPTLGDADVSIEVVGAATTVSDNDYDLFGADMIFSVAGQQSATLRLYNDAFIESLENLELELVINNPGSTDAFLGNISVLTISLDNDDFAPENQVALSNIVTADYESNMEGFTTTNAAGGQGPTGVYAQGTAADATSTYWTVPNPLNGSTGLVYANDDDCNCTMADVRFISPVYDLSTYTSLDLIFDVFFEGNTYQGNLETADLLVSTNGGSTYSVLQSINGINGTWREELVNLDAYVGQANFRFAFRYDDGGGWLYGIALDNVRLDGTVPAPPPVAVALNSIDEQDVLANEDVYFYHSDGSILALLENGSNDLGCVTVTIDRAGSDATEFWDNLPEHYLMDKTYLFTPEFNGPNYDYTVTLYLDRHDVTGWQDATANLLEQAFIIKHPTAISDVTPSNPEGNGPIEQEVDNAGPLSYSNDYSITASFTTGFSGMGVGLPGDTPLPVDLVNFTGVHIKNTANHLRWSTASELNNDYFDLERSFDGREFEPIAQIEGFGTTSEMNSYEFYDQDYKQGTHYYRLKQVDYDGRYTYSEVVVVEVELAGSKLIVFPNPTQSELLVSFASPVSGAYSLSVFSVNGKQMMNQNLNFSSEQNFRLQVDNLPKGVYYAEMINMNNGQNYQFRFVKE